MNRVISPLSIFSLALKKRLYTEHLYGIDKADKIARIARLNMYLHGDGGSTVFVADTLDGELLPPTGLSLERTNEVKELQQLLITERRKFDVVLTNPPFSISYQRKNDDERRMLNQYEIAVTKNGKHKSSTKSNVLFLERYCELLNTGGELLTVIDNTVLNGENSQRYRNFILQNFIIRQVIALPFNTFLPAQAAVQTSIIHLVKRENKNDEQGAVFMGILNNVGHDDHQRYTPERNNIPRLKEVWNHWRMEGEIIEVFEPNAVQNENLSCPFQTFVVPADELDPKRLDAFYYAPELARTQADLQARAVEGRVELLTGSDFHIVPKLTAREGEACEGKLFRYFEIGDVTREGAIVNYREDFFENLPTRARLQVQANDVLLAKNISSRGTAVIVPPEFDGHLVTTGFIAIRPETHADALLLWSIFTSEMFRKQVYYLAITAVQPEIRESIFEQEFLLPMLKSGEQRERLVACARQVHELQQDLRNAVAETMQVATVIFERSGEKNLMRADQCADGTARYWPRRWRDYRIIQPLPPIHPSVKHEKF